MLARELKSIAIHEKQDKVMVNQVTLGFIFNSRRNRAPGLTVGLNKIIGGFGECGNLFRSQATERIAELNLVFLCPSYVFDNFACCIILRVKIA